MFITKDIPGSVSETNPSAASVFRLILLKIRYILGYVSVLTCILLKTNKMELDWKSPDNLLLADAHEAQQHPKEAEMEYRKALELKPGDPAAHFGLGKMYCDDLKFEKAVPELEKVLQ